MLLGNLGCGSCCLVTLGVASVAWLPWVWLLLLGNPGCGFCCLVTLVVAPVACACVVKNEWSEIVFVTLMLLQLHPGPNVGLMGK
jgi:hypothetical protein